MTKIEHPTQAEKMLDGFQNEKKCEGVGLCVEAT
jgi:hypothetical protein